MNKDSIFRTDDPLIGRRVRVARPGNYVGQIVGQTGTVKAVVDTCDPNRIAVDLDFVVNNHSKYGYFYFAASDLEYTYEENNKTATAEEKGENEMNKLTNYLNVAVVQFLNDDVAFRTIECANYDPCIEVGALCVVQTASHGMGLAEVVEIKDHPEKELRREIVTGVDTRYYDERVKQREKAAELKTKMQERAKKLQDIALYQMLAKDDPEMAQLLEEFQGLPL